MALILDELVAPAPGTSFGGGTGAVSSPDGRFVAFASDGLSSKGVYAFEWDPDQGFGARYEPAATYGRAWGLDWSPDGNYVAVALENAPYLVVLPWLDPGFGAPLPGPATPPTGRRFAVKFSPAGTELVAAGTTVPRVDGWQWAAGFGPKFANPAAMPGGSGRDIAFHPSGSHVVVAHSNAPFISGWAFSPAGFGPKLPDPATAGLSVGLKVDFSDTGGALAFKNNGTDLTVWQWGPGYGTEYALPPGIGSWDAVEFAPGGTHIAFGSNVIPNPAVFAWSDAGGFGALVPVPASASPRDIAFTPQGNLLVNQETSGTFAYVTGGGWTLGYLPLP